MLHTITYSSLKRIIRAWRAYGYFGLHRKEQIIIDALGFRH